MKKDEKSGNNEIKSVTKKNKKSIVKINGGKNLEALEKIVSKLPRGSTINIEPSGEIWIVIA